MQTTQETAANRQRQALSDFINPEPDTYFIYDGKIILVSVDNGKCFFFKRGEDDQSLIRTSRAVIHTFDDALPETAQVTALPFTVELTVDQVKRLGVSEEILSFVLKHIGLKAV